LKQPFKIGQRIFEKQTGNTAKVTKHTGKGFEYKLDKPVNFIPRWGMQFVGGECFEAGFCGWEKFTGKNRVKPLETVYGHGLHHSSTE
jgi:hypothetical protein